jgi:hypothetical protein
MKLNSPGSPSLASLAFIVNRGSIAQQNLTRCAPCGAVAPRVLGTPATKIADKAKAGRLFCALPRVAYGTFRLAAKRRVNSTLSEIIAPLISADLLSALGITNVNCRWEPGQTKQRRRPTVSPLKTEFDGAMKYNYV